MILERGDMWSVFGKTDLFLITTNPIVRKDGGVVMGRGIAKQAADRFPKLPCQIGELLVNWEVFVSSTIPMYSAPVGEYDGQLIGFFMVKKHWREKACLDIIEKSVKDVCAFSQRCARIDLNFPGIGNGKLAREDVLPVISKLPDNVHVWEYA